VEGTPQPLTLACARIVNGEGAMSASPAWVSIANGRIVAIGVGAAPADAVDLADAFLAPGFVDLQVNGTGAVDFATATVAEIVGAVDTLAAGGATGLLLTLCSAPLDAYDDMLNRCRSARDARPDIVIGVHLEGPFLGGAPGAHPKAVLRNTDLAWLERVTNDDLVKMVTLAPEADPDLVATRALSERGVLVALGHSTVDYEGALGAADAGARAVTHLFNGMGPVHHRAPGLPVAALTEPRLVPSVIADFVHVHRAVVQLALGTRADAVLVTDAVRADATRLADGTLAGSTLTLNEAVCNVASLGFSTARAIRYATGNPARLLGLKDRGRVAPGARADLVALDPESLAVRAVWIGGERR
jgi:N-acetylglucosamine-6-phosphate deacetylase